ncbi:MAG: helix-turn-helix domain-containing protein [Clostridiales bacterium]|jgi:transcriptional regulator with XRE-family HTH domain|nr:helix-turn-helix domain-containing protein [Clostridiales bacterium]
MEIGAKIKRLRLQSKMTQEELANRCELTKGYISQLENDLTSPSIATLVDILESLGTNLKAFFSEASPEKVVYTADDFSVKEDESGETTWLVSNAGHMMEPLRIKIAPHSETVEDTPHEGEEFGYVLSGKIVIEKGEKCYECGQNCAFYFKSDLVHRIKNTCGESAEILWITCVP